MIKIDTFYQQQKVHNVILNTRYKSDFYLVFNITNSSDMDYLIKDISIKSYLWFIPIKNIKLNIKPFKLKGKSKVSLSTYIPKRFKNRIVVNGKYHSDKFHQIHF